FPTKLLLIAAGQMSGRALALPKRKQTDLDDEVIAPDTDESHEPAVVIRGKRLEGSSSDSSTADEEDEANEDEHLTDESADDDSDPDEADGAEAPVEKANEAAKPAAAQTGLASRLASALRIKNNGKNDEREEVLHQLDAAANRTDEII